MYGMGACIDKMLEQNQYTTVPDDENDDCTMTSDCEDVVVWYVEESKFGFEDDDTEMNTYYVAM